MKRNFILIFLLFFSVGWSARSALAQKTYKTYSNARFAYSISYPSDLLAAQGEAPNGDGQIFKSDDAEMRVYGSNNALDKRLKEIYQEAIDELGAAEAIYKVLRGNFFVVSGKKDGKILYRRTIKRGDQFLTFTIEYDESKRQIYDKATTKIVASFKS